MDVNFHFFGVNVQKCSFMLIFKKETAKLFPEWPRHFTFSPAVYERSSFSIFLPTGGVLTTFISAILF